MGNNEEESNISIISMRDWHHTSSGLNPVTSDSSDSSEAPIGGTGDSEQKKAIDPANMNLSIKPGDDFYEYAQGSWIKTHPVPADKSRYGEFAIVKDRNYERVRDIVESATNNSSAPEGSLEQKIGDFYRMGTDSKALARQQLDTIKPELKMIENVSSMSEIQTVSTQLMDYGIDPLFFIYAAPDKKNSELVIANLAQGGLGLPDRDFYFRQDSESVKIREHYLNHVANMFFFLGDKLELTENSARDIMKIETRLANASFTRVESHDEVKTYNKMSLEELQTFAPNIGWSRLFKDLSSPDITEVNVRNPSFFKELSNALQDESLDDWKTFLRWKVILATSPYLSFEAEREHFDFYGRKLNGQQKMKPRWKRALDAVNYSIGEAVGRVYVEKYFDPESKAKMQEMVSNLKKVFKERIQNLKWMEPETRKKAFLKLEALDVQVGYPDEWLDYSELEVKDDSYVRNVLRASWFQFHHGPYGLERIGKPVNRKLWMMNPQETNAYADFNKIIMVFPAGILQPPFFDKNAHDAVNYGAIGAIIGHEMTHHFDSQGRKFDADGNLTDWWTEKDADNFTRRAAVLVDQYNKFETLPDLYINGELTLQENIADLGGLTMAYYAYKLSLKEEPEIIDGLTGDQRFFLSFTQIWRESQTDEFLRTQTLTDMHSPSKFRVNGTVFNMPEFYNAFPEIKSGDKLYRPENERPVIW
ncbi:MAG: M13 family metallopeptidase [Methanosarcina sp.]